MIKIKNKNKFLTFLCACLVTCASAFGLVQAVGTTLASSPTEPTIDTTYLDYTSSSFLSKYDTFFYNGPPGSSNNTSTQIGLTFVEPISGMSATGVIGTNVQTFKVYCNYGRVGFTDILTNSLSFIKIYNYTSTVAALPSTYGLMLGFSDTSEIYNNYALGRDLIICFSYKNIYYVVGDYSLYSKYLAYTDGYDVGSSNVDTSGAYNQGYTDGYNQGNSDGYTEGYGEGQLDGYEDGYAEGQAFGYQQGINQVVNNPNQYGLYTSSQYETNYNTGYQLGLSQGYENGYNTGYNDGNNQGYTDGYNQGFIEGEHSSDAYQNGYNTGLSDGIQQVLDNPSNYNLYTQQEMQNNFDLGYTDGLKVARYGIFGDITYTVTTGVLAQNHTFDNPFVYYSSGLVYSSEVLDYFGSTISSATMQTTINFNQPFVFNDNIGFFLPSIVNASVDYTLTDINNNDYIYTYSITSSLDSDGVRVTTITNLPKMVDGSYLTGAVPTGTFINKLTFNIGNPISSFNIQEFYIHDLNSDYGQGYDVGFEDGVVRGQDLVNTQSYYDKGYNKGEVDGFNSGYAQGLANSNNATFASMISAVIDVPINAFRNLFNFEILGFDMFSFFTGLFTLIVIIFVIRIVVGLIK